MGFGSFGCQNSRVESAVYWYSYLSYALIVVVLSIINASTTHVAAATASGVRVARTIIPPWQTVLPDTNLVVDLSSENSRSNWTLYSTDGRYRVDDPRVPGDLLTNLLDGGHIQDPYRDRNFLTQRHVWMGDNADIRQDPDEGIFRYANRTRTWIYETTFSLDLASSTTSSVAEDENNNEGANWTWKLVVEGIKMGARIAIDDVHLGTVTDQFLRYIFPISSLQRSNSHNHTLTITFDPEIAVDGRFSACSGGWDWAPYVKALDAQGKRSYTLGITKHIYLVAVQDYAITHVVPKVYYRGSYPRTAMGSQPEGDFEVQVDVHLQIENAAAASSEQEYSHKRIVIWSPTTNEQVALPISEVHLASNGITGGEVTVSSNITFHSDQINLWWPNGMGDQPLYDLHVGFQSSASLETGGRELDELPLIRKKIGFRVAALVTINETDPLQFRRAIDGEGSGSHGMYFRINGALVFSRGSNVIPLDQLEGRVLPDAHRIVVKSAADANMNMLRVWGGGMVFPTEFYDACDEFGILLYHDMMFVDEAGHRPLQTSVIESEIRHLVRSLAAHPSIVVWNGCNECQVVMGTPTEIYATFVMQTVAEEDDSRSVWPSSPSMYGWKTGVSMLDSRPNGRALTTYDANRTRRKLESHGPYLRSFSLDFPGVNGIDVHFPYQNTPPKLPVLPVGSALPNVFASEFGSSVFSSFESVSETLSPRYWGLHGNSPPDQCSHVVGNENECFGSNPLAERNYPCDKHNLAYFGNATSLDGVGEAAFKLQLYQCIMAQTLWMKGEIEKRRSSNSYGLLVWQMNENWPTGGWGCIEYISRSDTNQIAGGRWKPLMHLLEVSLFRDVFAACGAGGSCYVRNDGQSTIQGTAVFESWDRSLLAVKNVLHYPVELLAGEILRLSLPSSFLREVNVMLIKVVDGKSSRSLVENVFLSQLPKSIPELGLASIQLAHVKEVNSSVAEVVIESTNLALFVVMTTRARGRFSENAFALRPFQAKAILFVPLLPNGHVDTDLLRRTLRIEHLGCSGGNMKIAQNNTTSFNLDVAWGYGITK